MTKKLRVLLLAPIAHAFPPIGYGPWELVCYNLAEGLHAMGIDTTVFTVKNAKTKAKKLWYWKDHILESDNASYIKTLIHILEAFKKSHRFDIIHNHLNVEPILFSKLTDIPMVTTLHGAACEKENTPLYQYLKKENFISISFAERKFAQYLNYVGNVYNGVDFGKYKVSKRRGKYLLFSGRITKEKGIDDAIRLSRETGIPLKIAGIITDKKYFRKKVYPILSKKIEYVGNLSYPKYSEVLRNSLALTFFIHWNEPFGLSALDALASGVPVIGYKRGAITEILYDKEMGFLVRSVKQAAGKLYELKNLDPMRIRDLAYDRFSREEMAEGYLQIYRKFV